MQPSETMNNSISRTTQLREVHAALRAGAAFFEGATLGAIAAAERDLWWEFSRLKLALAGELTQLLGVAFTQVAAEGSSCLSASYLRCAEALGDSRMLALAILRQTEARFLGLLWEALDHTHDPLLRPVLERQYARALHADARLRAYGLAAAQSASAAASDSSSSSPSSGAIAMPS
jgi:hypothetical protein